MDYKDSSNKYHSNTNPPSYIWLKKSKKAYTIVPSRYENGVKVFSMVWYGKWKSKGDKVIVTTRIPKVYEVYGSNFTTTYKMKKNGNLEEIDVSKDRTYLNKNDAITKEKFNKDFKKYSKFKKHLAKVRNGDDKNTDNKSDGSQNVDPDEIGRAVYARVFPSEQVDSVEKDGDSYYVNNEYHSADSTVEFQINGDTVTYWTQSGGDTTADGKNDAHTVKIEDLLGN